MNEGSWLEIPWPVAGVDRSLGYQQQPPYTTPDALNVRTESTSEFRERGGSRPGLGLAIRTQLGSPAPGEIRLLTKVSVVKAQWSKNYAPLGGTQLRDVHIPVPWQSAPTYVTSTSDQGTGAGLSGASWGLGIPVIDYRDTNQPYEVTVHVRPTDLVYDGQVRIALGLTTTTADPDVASISVYLILENDGYSVRIDEVVGSVIINTSTSATFTDNPNAPGIFAVRVVPGTNTLTAYWRHRQMLSDTVGTLGSHYVAVETVSADSSIIATKLSTEFGRDTSLSTVFADLRRDVLVAVSDGEIWMEDTADSMRLITTDVDVNSGVDLVAVDREQKLFIADYGVVATGTAGSIASPYNTLLDGSFNFAAAGIDGNYVFEFINSDYSQNEKQEITISTADGGTWTLQFRGQVTGALAWNVSAGGIKAALELLTTIDTVTVTGTNPWTVEFTGTHTGASVETLGSDITALTHATGTPTIAIVVTQEGAGGDFFLGQYQITGVTATEITFNPPLPVSDGFSGTIGMVEYQLVRAAKVFDPKAETLVVHSASTGFAPAGCRLVALYRDRIVYAGSDLLPHIWYMSRQGDPWDWDYSQEDSAAAVAAQSSVAGQLADPITALVPHSDECLFFGCYNSLWIMRGDPGYGGTLDQLSRKIGIVSARAWCRTPDDMMVFMSADGLYVTPAGCAGFPTSLSRERLPDELLCLNAARESIHLEYDTVHRGIHIFVTKRDGSEASHWWFDWEAKSFWRMSLQTDHEPFAVHERIAWDDCPVVLVGGRDGYIRYFDRQFQVDDGDNEIVSYCDLGPFHLDPDNIREGVLTEMTGVAGVDTGPIDWAIRAGASAQEANEATSQATGTWDRSGLNFTTQPRVRGVSGFLRVSNGAARERWFLERITALVRAAGRRRAR